jgi:hypothetical protein
MASVASPPLPPPPRGGKDVGGHRSAADTTPLLAAVPGLYCTRNPKHLIANLDGRKGKDTTLYCRFSSRNTSKTCPNYYAETCKECDMLYHRPSKFACAGTIPPRLETPLPRLAARMLTPATLHVPHSFSLASEASSIGLNFHKFLSKDSHNGDSPRIAAARRQQAIVGRDRQRARTNGNSICSIPNLSQLRVPDTPGYTIASSLDQSRSLPTASPIHASFELPPASGPGSR